VVSTSLERRTGREGPIASKAIRIQFANGTKKSRHVQGDRPASSARRSVIDTPIHRKGSAQSASTIHSHSGAGRSCSVFWENTGFR